MTSVPTAWQMRCSRRLQLPQMQVMTLPWGTDSKRESWGLRKHIASRLTSLAQHTL